MSKKIKIILTKEQPKLGHKGEVREVASGYARNYLFPQNIAILATPENLRKLEHEQKQKIEQAQINKTLLKPVLQKIEIEGLEFAEKASETGKLFGSINENTLAKALSQKYNLQIEPKQIKIEKPIKEVGKHKAELKFDEDETVQIEIRIKAFLK